ncbi:MAG: Arc family DNA binding domain-containing protein [Planctomycetaceae bacterium]|nr:Arc family DNA binding domain-containing protein [Planctomycetaceae bacterium]
MAKRDSFLVRMDPAIIKALKQWAADELRSVNGQVEYVIRDALRKEGRLPKPKPSEDTSS